MELTLLLMSESIIKSAERSMPAFRLIDPGADEGRFDAKRIVWRHDHVSQDQILSSELLSEPVRTYFHN